jgi:hypothetical protein
MKSDLHSVYGLAFVLVADVLVGWNGLKPFTVAGSISSYRIVHHLLRSQLAEQPTVP